MPELILALDVGTTTAKAAVFDPGGAMIGLGRRRLATLVPGRDRAEQDAEAVWLAVQELISAALGEADRAPADLAAIGIATQRASLIAFDRRTGAPLTPLILWSDGRGGARAEQLRAAGFFVSAQQAACKAEDLVAVLTRGGVALGGLDSWVIHRLTGEHVTDRSQAWPLGWLDLASLEWNEPLLDFQGLDRALLPRLVDTHGPIATSTRDALGAAIPLTASIADQQAALFVHADAPGAAKITFGTAAALDLDTGSELTFKGANLPPLIVAHVAGRTRWCVEGMISDAGSAGAGEDLAIRLRDIADLLVAPGAALSVDGGRTADAVLMQMCAERLQRPLRRFEGGEATLAGAALAAGLGAGLLAEPDRPCFARYDEVFAPA